MLATEMSGTILIRDHTPLPAGLAIESEAFLPAWKAVKNLDGHELGRKIEKTKWSFFYLAGEIKVTVLGSDDSKTLRRAVKRALAKQERQFNSLEITSVVSKRFLGLPLVKVVAHTRHIQQGICLVPAKDFALGNPVPAALQTETAKHQVEVPLNQYTALISNS
jgi:hypothetical protein